MTKSNTADAATKHAAPVAKSLDPIHDAAQQARNLRHVLQDDKQRIGCFLGAGCPLGIYDPTGQQSAGLIPAIIDLTKRIANGLEAADSAAGATSKFRANWDSLRSECTTTDGQDPTIEDVLTELRTLSNRRGSAEILEMSKKDLSDLDDKICALISAEVRKPLPPYRNAYNRFASWIGGIHRDSPAEIFTTNYDLLLEQALEQNLLPHFDGFVGSREP